ncbi:hypothetical protein TNCV_972241 [Trichonephila clavipes]|nr:hypothetical protein TNCV_972241 [Trichonephila clavipes]
MFDPSSFANPTPLAHADTSRDVLPRGALSGLDGRQLDRNKECKARTNVKRSVKNMQIRGDSRRCKWQD